MGCEKMGKLAFWKLCGCGWQGRGWHCAGVVPTVLTSSLPQQKLATLFNAFLCKNET